MDVASDEVSTCSDAPRENSGLTLIPHQPCTLGVDPSCTERGTGSETEEVDVSGLTEQGAGAGA